MPQAIQVRELDEWMYAINEALTELGEGPDEAVSLLRSTLDRMRERRAQLRMVRHNEEGY